VPTWGSTAEVATIRTGSYFGELAMLTGQPRGSYVMATSYCIISVLEFMSVEALVEEHPEAFTTLVQTMINLYHLKPQTTWDDISHRLMTKFHVQDSVEAFNWFRQQAGLLDADADELTAKSFDEGLRRLKVKDLDRRIHWADLDEDANGGISLEELSLKLRIDAQYMPPSTMSGLHSHRSSTESTASSVIGYLPGTGPRSSRLFPINSAGTNLATISDENFTPANKAKRRVDAYASSSSHPFQPQHHAPIASSSRNDDSEELDPNGGDSLEMLLEQNRRLLERIQRMSATRTSFQRNISGGSMQD
jgi:hypothetical protein